MNSLNGFWGRCLWDPYVPLQRGDSSVCSAIPSLSTYLPNQYNSPQTGNSCPSVLQKEIESEWVAPEGNASASERWCFSALLQRLIWKIKSRASFENKGLKSLLFSIWTRLWNSISTECINHWSHKPVTKLGKENQLVFWVSWCSGCACLWSVSLSDWSPRAPLHFSPD